VRESNDAHTGLFEMKNRNRSRRSASRAVGAKLYRVPTVAAVSGAPQILGAAALASIAGSRKSSAIRETTSRVKEAWVRSAAVPCRIIHLLRERKRESLEAFIRPQHARRETVANRRRSRVRRRRRSQ